MPAAEARSRLVPPLLILAAVALSYFNAAGNGFIYDDTDLIRDNPLIRGWHNLPEIFTTGYWTAARGSSYGLYRPLAISSFVIDHAIGGLSPLAYHLDNILIHFLCSVMVYLVLKAVTGRGLPAAFSALIFAVHPVHTEAVTWLSGRAEILCVLLLLMSFWVFLTRRQCAPWVFISAAVFMLALLAKETAAVLPLIVAVYLLLYDAEGGRRERLVRLAKALWPFAVALLVYLLIRSYVLAEYQTPPESTVPLHDFPPYQRPLTMITAFFHYIRLGLVPTGLSAFYYFFTSSWLDYTVVAVLLLAAGLAVFSRKLARNHRDASFGMSVFLVSLLPVSNIVPSGIIMSERAMYLPSLGICLLLGLAFSRLAGLAEGRSATYRPAAYALFAAAALLLSATTVARNPFWGDIDRFREAELASAGRQVEIMPEAAISYMTLAYVRVYNQVFGEETYRVIDRGLSLAPDDASLHYLKGLCLEHDGRVPDALREYEASASLSPDHTAFYRASSMLVRLGRPGEAEAMLDSAIRLNPYRGAYHFNKGLFRYQNNDLDGAYAFFRKARDLDPSNYKAYVGLGMVECDRGELDRSVGSLVKAIELEPGDAEAHYYLAVAYMKKGETALAAGEAGKALGIAPGHADARALMERISHAD